MILGSEWTAYHLTPSGWVMGDKQREFAPLLSRPAPPDRMVSVVNKICAKEYGTSEVVQREVWRGSDDSAIQAMIKLHGSAPKEL